MVVTRAGQDEVEEGRVACDTSSSGENRDDSSTGAATCVNGEDRTSQTGNYIGGRESETPTMEGLL